MSTNVVHSLRCKSGNADADLKGVVDRDKTVSILLRLEWLGLPLSEKQIPQIVEMLRSAENRKKLWKPSGCAQGRCATRLRYAPTSAASLILKHLSKKVAK